jgi:hypothetical protein
MPGHSEENGTQVHPTVVARIKMAADFRGARQWHTESGRDVVGLGRGAVLSDKGSMVEVMDADLSDKDQRGL